jgi:hypothetical protein
MTTKISEAVLPFASTTVLGGVKVDGTTITINSGTGVISGANTTDFSDVSITGGTIATTKLQSYREAVTTVTVSTGTYNLNLNLSNIFDITLNTSCTFTFTNPPASGTAMTATIILRQGAGGSKSAAFTNAKYSEGTLPTLSTTAGHIDVLTFFTVNGGTFWFGTFAMANVS